MCVSGGWHLCISVLWVQTRVVFAANPAESIYLNAYFYAYPVALTFIALSPLLTLIIVLICFFFFYLMLKNTFDLCNGDCEWKLWGESG